MLLVMMTLTPFIANAVAVRSRTTAAPWLQPCGTDSDMTTSWITTSTTPCRSDWLRVFDDLEELANTTADRAETILHSYVSPY